jgi:arylsulfatase A-like enzyme
MPVGPPKNGNVVLLSIDSLRADMPWSGYSRPIAPRLTELERKAVSYTRAHSVSSYTSMSLGGLLAGKLPSELNRSGYFFGTYKHDLFFPKLLQSAGVHTMGVMAHMYFKSAGFDDGFDDWRIVPGITFDPNTDRDVTSPQSEELAEKLLGDPANDSRRFFFWAHFLDPHDLYERHAGIDWGKSSRDRYDGEVTFTDEHVGKLLDFIAGRPWAGRTVVIVTSDHGEEFGEHNMTRHGFEVWETLVHVPLMVVAPGAAPRHIDIPRSAIDLAPTILDFLGVPADASFEGQSLVSEIYGGPTEERDVVVDLPMTSDNGRRRALIHGSEKLICFDNDGYCKLYDLDKDPMESTPSTKGPEHGEMKRRYGALARSIKEVVPYACAADCLNNAYRRKEN